MRAAGMGLGLLARVILLIAAIVFLIIALGIILIVLDANSGNVIVQLVTGAARFLVGPFDGLFTIEEQQLETAINWGIAAFVWLLVGTLLARLLRAAGGRRARA